MIRVSICQRNKARGIFTWYARIFDTETKAIRYESLGTTRKTEAFELMCEKKKSGDYENKFRDMTTLGRVVELYEKDCESRGCNAASVTTLHHYLLKLKAIFHRPVSEITKIELVETLNESTKDCRPSTYNNVKTTVRTVFRFAKDVLELIDSSPADALKSRKNPPKERDFWTMEQVESIVCAAENPEMRLCFAFMGYAGLRIHEAVKVKSEDVRDGFLYVVGKGNKFAKVPVGSRMQAEIDRYGKPFDLGGLGKHNVIYSLRKAAKKALGDSLKGSANPHRLRHSFASNALRAGVGPKTLQKLLRHSNITTTLNIYTHIIDEDLTNEIEKMFK